MQFHSDGTLPGYPNAVFVFGSNLQGIHGAGAALAAKRLFGAKVGVGVGRTGHAYAIPTKETPNSVLPKHVIKKHVKDFLAYARANDQYVFFVTRIGCGLAGFTDSEIAVLFRGAPKNCDFAREWKKHLEIM